MIRGRGPKAGDSWWTYPPGIRLPGSGAFKEEFPADPLRIFRVSDGKRVASLGSFPGGLNRSRLIMVTERRILAFYDAVGAIRFWNPLQPGLSVVVARGGNHYFGGNLLFSKDGSANVRKFSRWREGIRCRPAALRTTLACGSGRSILPGFARTRNPAAPPMTRPRYCSSRSVNQRRMRVHTSSLPTASSTPCSMLGLSLTSITTMPSGVCLRSTP